jgi:nucleotide-binding universal stress UspA family protein
MKTILVPTDFTPAARNASEYAVLLARSVGAEIYLLHVYTEPMPVTVGPEPWSHTTSQLRVDNEKNINKEIERLKEQYGVAVNGSVVPGFKGDSINETANAIGADLVVMGVKAAHKKGFPGSTATKMVRKSSRPVLIVPEEHKFRSIKNAVLAIDFNEMVSSSDLSAFFQLMKAFDASVSVLHIVKKGADLEASEVSAKMQMGIVLSKITYSYDQVEDDDVDKGILDFTNNHPTDLLAMIAHHHSLIERLFNPIHTKAISVETRLPLLVLKTKPPTG